MDKGRAKAKGKGKVSQTPTGEDFVEVELTYDVVTPADIMLGDKLCRLPNSTPRAVVEISQSVATGRYLFVMDTGGKMWVPVNYASLYRYKGGE